MKTQHPILNPSPITYKGMGGIIHIIAWGILFGMPFFFTGRESDSVTVESYIRFVLMPLSFMFIFYMNYLSLVERYLFKHSTLRFILVNVMLIILTMTAVHFLMRVLPDHAVHVHPRPNPPFREIFGFFLGNALLYMLVAGLSVAIRMTGSWYEMESTRKELERSRTEAELQNLKSQLNPHFLFNTLNNIYSLIAFSPERAQEAVHDLSRLLRYVLYDSSQASVPLEKELDFIRDYVELMRIRLPEHVELSVEISHPAAGISIAPLLFISLIENAFKHGVSNSEPSYIRIRITAEDAAIACDIRNSSFPKLARDKSGSGIGLVNLQKRLSLLYPENHTFAAGQQGNEYRAWLRITF